jgi:NAD(P)-dependent dehydrogenase (short-subunit alcohol dehydrogenase family)
MPVSHQLLARRRVLVTGAARGLGLEFATAIVPQQRYRAYHDGRARQRLQLPEDVSGGAVRASRSIPLDHRSSVRQRRLCHELVQLRSQT